MSLAASIPMVGAAAWMTANWVVPLPTAGSRRTATRVAPGAICLIVSSHLLLKANSKFINPVALPARPREAIDEPSGDWIADHREYYGYGAAYLLQCAYCRVVMSEDSFSASATNSAACLWMVLALAPAQRVSICTLRPIVHPDSASACRKAPTQV